MPEWTHQVDMGMMSPAQASVAQLDRVLGYEPSGHRFESCRVHQTSKSPHIVRAFCYLRFGYCCHPRDLSCVYSGSCPCSSTATRLNFSFELCPVQLILRRTSSAQAPSGGFSQAFVISKIFASLIFKPCMIAPVSPAGACGIPPWTYPVVTQHPALPIMN